MENRFSCLDVGFDSGKMIGGDSDLLSSVKTSSLKIPPHPLKPINTLGCTFLITWKYCSKNYFIYKNLFVIDLRAFIFYLQEIESLHRRVVLCEWWQVVKVFLEKKLWKYDCENLIFGNLLKSPLVLKDCVWLLWWVPRRRVWKIVCQSQPGPFHTLNKIGYRSIPIL